MMTSKTRLVFGSSARRGGLRDRLRSLPICGQGRDRLYFSARVERGNIHDVVEVTGTINAVTTVLVGSQVSGTIAKLNADFNSRVHKGEVIAVIDPALFRGALLQAEADLDSAKANVVAAHANLDKAKATLAQAQADFDRADRRSWARGWSASRRSIRRRPPSARPVRRWGPPPPT